MAISIPGDKSCSAVWWLYKRWARARLHSISCTWPAQPQPQHSAATLSPPQPSDALHNKTETSSRCVYWHMSQLRQLGGMTEWCCWPPPAAVMAWLHWHWPAAARLKNDTYIDFIFRPPRTDWVIQTVAGPRPGMWVYCKVEVSTNFRGHSYCVKAFKHGIANWNWISFPQSSLLSTWLQEFY